MSYIGNLLTSALVWEQATNQVNTEIGYIPLYRALVHYAGGKALPGAVTYAGTGDGLIQDIDGGVDAPSETWTIVFSDATDFTVDGSVSLSQAGGSIGENYVTTSSPLDSLISFRIEAGGTAFQAGDTFTIPVTVGPLASHANQWILDRWSPFTTAGDTFAAIDDQTTNGTTGALIWHGQGSSESWQAGIAVAPSLENWALRAYTGFSASASWDTNLGASPETFIALFDTTSLRYWLVVNSRRIVVVAKVGANLHAMYQGAILPFASPAEWPYPMLSTGENEVAIVQSETGDIGFSHGIVSAGDDTGHLRDNAGNWLIFNSGATSPNGEVSNYPFGVTSGINPRAWWVGHENFPSGDHQLMPITLVHPPQSGLPLTGDTFGVLDGCFAVTGFALTAETVLSIGGTDHLVVNDIFRTSPDDFWALELA